ncbi:MAG: Gfo/Idh/MocA family oxidoreductase [Pirellulales bacterium]|nr:Gfo/Idh/MocA family oxidoreductase [Pirellulales bacterium]
MKLRVGLIGLGANWEKHHRPALRTLSDRFEVRAVYDQVAHRAETAARETRAVAVDGFHTLAERDDVDAIMMLSQDWYGVLPLFAACDAGKAVYCATGLGFDPEQARQLKERVERSGVAFMAEFPRRHAPATIRLKELIATRLGAPQLLFCHHRVPVSEPTSPEQRLRTPSSPAVSYMIELVDWCRYVVGTEPTSLISIRHLANPGQEYEDYQMLSLDFSVPDKVGTGTVAQISCGRYMPARWQEAVGYRPPAALQVACERGIAFIDLPSTLIWFDEAGRHQESLDHERPVGELLLQSFYREVTSLVRNRSNLDDSYRALEIVWHARDSQLSGQRQTIRGR